ncbi:regulator of ime2 [Recurvomyces mirabilis]|nr:regulator of ime2 [Recurvomyces mirabilis]
MGLLRPATPLSVIFFVAFVLLLLSTLSTPIIHAIPLGAFQGYNFGVFGYCKGDQCSGFKIGYSTDNLFTGPNANDFTLPSSTRHSLSAILIVHPIAAFLVLICFGLACAAHFHSPSHSPRYLLGLLILTVPTLLVTLLAFLVDILLFVPHMQWGGWIVLAATILIIASSVVTCAMRRTLVSRKARKKRIAENAEMNGTNYYENMNQNRLMADELPRADSPPPMSGTTAADKAGLASFATFEMKHTNSAGSGEGTLPNNNDDRTPLNPTREQSIRSASTGRRPYGPQGGEDMPPIPHGRPSMESNGNGMGGRPSRDQYGNIIPAAAAIGMAGDLPSPGLRHQGSQGSMGSNRSGGYQRGGRAGYGPPGRGYGPPRGGYGPPRGGYGPRGGFRGQGPPPPGWRGRGGYGPPPGMMRGGGRPGPPPGYAGPPPNDGYYSGPRSGPASPTMDGPPPPMHDEFVAGPIGQAIEMDERHGSPPIAGQRSEVASPYGLRDSDGDVAGMVGLQQGRNSPMRRESERSSAMRSTSDYSDQYVLLHKIGDSESLQIDSTYVPPRAQWQQQPPPLHHQDSESSRGLSSTAAPSSRVLPLSPVAGSPRSPLGMHAPHHARGGSDAYYEDVDPRFAVDPASEVGHSDYAGPLPTALTPGGYGPAYGNQRMPTPTNTTTQDPNLLQAPARIFHNNSVAPQDRSNIPSYVSGTSVGAGDASSGSAVVASGVDTDNAHSTPSLERPPSDGHVAGGSNGTGPDNSYENLPMGARSPGEGSEASHFTSISQRPINPDWRPQGGSAYGGSMMGPPPSSASAAQRRREDVILTANPDFALPGMSPMGRGRGRGRGGGMAGMSRMASPPIQPAMVPGGRYPTDI